MKLCLSMHGCRAGSRLVARAAVVLVAMLGALFLAPGGAHAVTLTAEDSTLSVLETTTLTATESDPRNNNLSIIDLETNRTLKHAAA
jgi:hypothetical protein